MRLGNRSVILLNRICAESIKEGRSFSNFCDWLINGTDKAKNGRNKNNNKPRIPNTNANTLGILNLTSRVSVIDRIKRERIKDKKMIVSDAECKYYNTLLNRRIKEKIRRIFV